MKTTQKIRASAIALILLASVVGSLKARAEDDLLSILSGSGAGANSALNQAAESPLRKLVTRATPEQNIFFQFVEKGEMDKALYQWPTAFESTEFGKSVSGRALNAWILFRNGIQVTAVEQLLTIDKPSDIHPEIAKAWKESAPADHSVWGLINVPNWNAGWTDVFGVATEVRVRGRQIYSADQVELIKELIRKTQLDTRERAWLEWQLVLNMSLTEDAGTAAKALAHLMKVKNNPVSEDLMNVTAARLLYQNGFLDAAQKYYEKVPKASDYWFDGQEEMGWAFVRKGEPQNAIALTTTLTNPVFASQVGPEPIFLRALAQLKVCDYPGVVATLKLFRDRYRTRAKTLLQIAENPETPTTTKFISRMKTAKVTLKELGKDASELPRFVTRDEVLSQLVQIEKALETEGKQAGDLYSRSLSGGTGQVGFQARLEQFRQSVDSRVRSARSASLARVKALADEEVNEIAGILQKLHIVEAEVLQQLSLADRVVSASATKVASEKKGTTGSQSKDRIWFPAENETWFDELANYRLDVKKGCESVKR